ncbi:Asparagine synthetase domain-containing protein [Mycena sanguinolenta]|uniref:Asparagine synthetase domain-containing protein n=1 Tax=Mycena sanguinolenta TaxID=230812 RepID=A0A8H6ZIG8_9AGAR|nr:Asparagine synthetase domain-containing protein [Mycena sanguinolenta]
MCGLISAFYPDGVTPPAAEALEQSLNASLDIIEYRGPDSRGTYVSPDGRVGLGHVRLSIIDLETGLQPLSDEDNLIHCVVTGEIYDHDRIRTEMQSQGYSFKTKCDSELVVQLYKRDGLNLLFHLRGEFAFVLYDVKRRLLLAVRDRFGIKPLYYTVSDGCILFGSEMKTFMPLGWRAEWDIASIVNYGDFGDERTVFKGVKKGDLETQSYWDLSYPLASASPSTSIDSMIQTVRDLLVESVRLRLRSDVPWAVYLSGGIDSSSVAGIATQLLRETDPNAKLTAFTLAFVESEATDESPLAERTAAHIGADLVKVEATEAKLVGILEECVWHSEMVSATFHGAGKLLLSKAVHDAGYKVNLLLSPLIQTLIILCFQVVLSGEGSDEVFGGYPWFPLDYLRDSDPAAAKLGINLPSEAERHPLAEEYQAVTGIKQLPPDALSLHKSDGPRHLLKISGHLSLESIFVLQGTDLYRPGVVDAAGGFNVLQCIEEGVNVRVRQNSISGDWHSLNVSLYTAAKSFLGRGILNFVGDRADMAHAVESRVTFLDHHLVEYVNRIPPSLKIRPVSGDQPGKWSLVEKWILREAVKPFVTEEIYLRKKNAFNPPPSGPPAVPSDLLPLQAHLKARITQVSVEKLGFIEWGYIQGLLEEYLTEPRFSEGNIDPRGRMLMLVLSYIVLQERFDVPTYKC